MAATADEVSPSRGSRRLFAISVSALRAVYSPDRSCYRWLDARVPVAMPGNSILVYDLTNDPAGQLELAKVYLKAGWCNAAGMYFQDHDPPKEVKANLTIGWRDAAKHELERLAQGEGEVAGEAKLLKEPQIMAALTCAGVRGGANLRMHIEPPFGYNPIITLELSSRRSGHVKRHHLRSGRPGHAARRRKMPSLRNR